MKHKIIAITDACVEFDNGSVITCEHIADCCEYNYADFEQLEVEILNKTFDLSKLVFERSGDYGFRFGDSPLNMWFVPCYSDQNGWYSNDLDIYYDNNRVLQVYCEEI